MQKAEYGNELPVSLDSTDEQLGLLLNALIQDAHATLRRAAEMGLKVPATFEIRMYWMAGTDE